MAHRRTARLSGWQKWLVSLSGAGLWLSGAAWLLLHLFGQREGEFGPEINPLEPLMMKAHGLVLIPMLMGIGAMLVVHIPKGWTQRRQRLAGIILCAVLAVLILSGYLLYYAGGEELRRWTSIAHWTIGLVLPLILAWHWIRGVSLRQGNGSGKRAREGKNRDRTAAPYSPPSLMSTE